MPTRHTKLAIVYDFDGTLAPGNMQDRQFIPDVRMEPREFWDEVENLTKQHNADKILMYMQLMLIKANEAKISVHREDFTNLGRCISFFEGVSEWFDVIKKYGKKNAVCVEHYLISSGNGEIIDGTSIASKFERIYASRFVFNHNDVPVWPAQAINFTTKTQYLFRINKGALDPTNECRINKYVKEDERPVPFKNMIYIGDGETDVPSFRLVKDLGGLSIVVYPPRTKDARSKAKQYFDDGRVHCVVPADYTEGKDLYLVVKSRIDEVSARAKYENTLEGMR